jgi:solute carrier family 13 (sodium-dependent dicarboxylate transporter), member 2/3/5
MAGTSSPGRSQTWGFWAGLLALAAMLAAPLPAGLDAAGWRVAAVGALMAIWWFTEAIPISATALLPFVLFPVLGIAPAAKVAGSYWSPIIMLVLGGALVALAVEKAGLHRRLALAIARRGGSSPRSLVAAFMLATAVVSMGVSNTATALIMMPIALALVAAAAGTMADADRDRFATGLILGVAYAASIGGLGTLVGSPTNAIAAGLINKALGIHIDFLLWAAFGLPLVLIGVPAAAWLVNRMAAVPTAAIDRTVVLAAIGDAGPITRYERRLLPVLAVLLAGWIVLPFVKDTLFGGALKPVEDGMVAVFAGLLLFVLPSGSGRARLLEWGDARGVPWDVLLLFGGGLALADGITGTGLAAWLGLHLQAAGGLPVWLLAALIVALIIVVTEFASNVATASGFVPVIAALVLATGADPQLLAIPAAMAASWGFMMPAGTGPNAIAYATGRVSVAQMVRAGFAIDLLGVPLIVAVCFAVAALLQIGAR